VWYSVLQCITVCCSILQGHTRADQLQCVAVWYSVLQCITVCCSILQVLCVAVYCKDTLTQINCSVLQCGTVCCSVLQCGTVYCSALQCVAVYCKYCVLQYIARTHSRKSTESVVLGLKICYQEAFWAVYFCKNYTWDTHIYSFVCMYICIYICILLHIYISVSIHWNDTWKEHARHQCITNRICTSACLSMYVKVYTYICGCILMMCVVETEHFLFFSQYISCPDSLERVGAHICGCVLVELVDLCLSFLSRLYPDPYVGVSL